MGQMNSARSNGSTKSAYAGGKPFYALVSNNHPFFFFLCTLGLAITMLSDDTGQQTNPNNSVLFRLT